jgi:hypothetical protein
MFLVGLILFLAVYWGVATASAWFLYKMSRGYEAAPPLAGADLWKRSALAGGVALGITVGLGGVGILAVAVIGKDPARGISWILLGVEVCAWTLYCVWLCELENLFQGALYALLWMFVLRVVAFVVFLPFGVGIRLLGGLGFS